MHPYLTALLSVLASITVFRFIRDIITARNISQETVLNELEGLAKPRHGRKIKGTAVIAGGSIAGLLAARVCSDHFEQVVIVEPEAWVATDEGVTIAQRQVKEAAGENSVRSFVNKRARVPQTLSLHGFQALSLSSLRKMFPSFDAEVKAEGGKLGPADYKMNISGVPLKVPYHTGGMPEIMWITRITYETILRRLVRKNYSNVRTVVGLVTGINPSPTNPSEIASVTLRTNDQDVVQEASLVVDCAGPIHAGLKWLKAAGYGNPPAGEQLSPGKLSLDNLMVKYDPKMSYVTAEWPLTDELRKEIVVPGGIDNESWLCTYLPESNRDNQTFAAGIVDGNRLQILCGGWGDVTIPKNAAGIKEYADRLKPRRPIPAWFYTLLSVLGKHEDIATYELVRIPSPTSVQYPKAMNLPSNFVGIGDSVMRVNPVFGQGCTKAMLGAVTLDSALRSITESAIPANFARDFFIKHNGKIAPIWGGTKTPDYGWNTTVPIPGESLSKGAFIRWYSNEMLWAATKDDEVASAFWHIRMFLRPSSDLFAPSVIFKILKHALIGDKSAAY